MEKRWKTKYLDSTTIEPYIPFHNDKYTVLKIIRKTSCRALAESLALQIQIQIILRIKSDMVTSCRASAEDAELIMEMLIAYKKLFKFHLMFIIKFVFVISNKPNKKLYNKFLE